MSVLLALVVVALLLGAGLLATLRRNATQLRRVEDFDPRSEAAARMTADLSRRFDDPALAWRAGLARDGVTIDTTLTQQELGAPVRTYRVTSWLREEEVPVDRMIELLDGGFLREEVWYKKDFKGGQCLAELARSASASDWIAQYVSAVPPFRRREFVYLLSRREIAPEGYSTRWHPPGEVVARQTCIAYRSVAHATGSRGMVRAIQYPSLDRITRYGSGLIRWEHIMAFHIAGVFPQWLTNALAGPAMEVLLQEALNMRKHRRAAPHPG